MSGILRYRSRSVSANALAIIAVLAVAASAHAAPQHQTVQTDTSSAGQAISQQQVNELPLPSNAYGAGAYRLITLTPGGQTAKWEDFDANKNLREDDIFQFSTTPGGSMMTTEEIRDYFNDRGTIGEQTISKWNLNGSMGSYEFKSYDLHGSLTSDHLTKYDLNLHLDYNWNPYNGKWDTTTIPDRPAATPNASPAPSGASNFAPNLLVNQKIGFLFPRDYRPGDLITGSAWKPDYAEAFKSVPGFSEYTLPIQTYNFANGTPNWSGLEIGVKGYGYVPFGPNGTFSLRLPPDYDYKSALQFQVRQDDAPLSSAGSYGQFGIDSPLAAPAIPQNVVPAHLDYWLATSKTDYLIDLWNDAYNLELEWSEADENGASDSYLGEIEDDLHDVYKEIDFVTSQLPAGVATHLAHQLARRTRELNDEFVAANPNGLSTDQKDELSEYQGWASFLDDEAEEASGISWITSALQDQTPYWTSPVLSQNRLGALRGMFSGAGYDDQVHLDGIGLYPIVETPRCFYFMPTDGLSAGLHNFQIDGYGAPETTLPVFYMWLNMWVDDPDMHKGQKTTYHLTLTGLNGLPSWVWGSSFYASDLMSPSDLQGGVPDSSGSGSVTLTITDQTPGVIAMKNVYTVLNAKSFAPSGTFQINGGVGAILDGGFNILGVARSFLQPEWAWGPALGHTMTLNTDDQSSGQTPGSSSMTSTASAPGTSPCDYGAGAASSDPLPPIDFSKICVGPETARMVDDALAASGGPNSTYVDNTPAKPTREEAQKRVADAEKALADWVTRCKEEHTKATKAWAAGLKNVPQGFLDDMAENEDARGKADKDVVVARGAYGKDPSAENAEKLKKAQEDLSRCAARVQDSRNAVEERFTPAQRAAYEGAQADARSADFYAGQARAELDDARDALNRDYPPQSPPK